jgi:hypothetical protein
MTVVSIHRGFRRRIGSRLNAKRAADSTKDAANDATHDTAKRSCCLGAHSDAMRGAVRNALSLRHKRASK